MFTNRQGIFQLKTTPLNLDQGKPQSFFGDNESVCSLKLDIFSTASADKVGIQETEQFESRPPHEMKIDIFDDNDEPRQLCMPEDFSSDNGFDVNKAVVALSAELHQVPKIMKLPKLKANLLLQSINFQPYSVTYFGPEPNMTREVKIEELPVVSLGSSTLIENEPTSQEIRSKKTKKMERTKNTDSSTLADLFLQKKNTNIPKKIVAILHTAVKRLIQSATLALQNPGLKEEQREYWEQKLSLLLKTNKRLDRKKKFQLGTLDLESFFGGERTENEMQEQNQQNRGITKKALSQLVYEEVLNNDSIPIENKFSYLKCIRVLEWRMRRNEGRLASRIQSLS